MRGLLAVVAGYAGMALLVIVGQGALLALAPEGSFDRAESRLEAPWLQLTVAWGAVAGVAGGYLCAFVARRSELTWVILLAAFVFAMWWLYVLNVPEGQSAGYQAALQLVGVLGVLVGGGLRVVQRSHASAS